MIFQTPDFQLLYEFGIALLIGALVGVEREKRKALKHVPSFAGIRTFILLSEAGAVAAWLARQTGQTSIFTVSLAGLSVLIAIAYVLEKRVETSSVGLTTELAALVVFLLGAAVMFGYASVAVALAVVNTSLLAFKGELHGAVGKLGQDDIYAGLKLLIASFIVLPLLPNTLVDPWQALNPYKLWLLVIMISAISLVGYVATRTLGSARGVAVTGVTGGLVSSTAVTLSMSRESKELGHEKLGASYSAGILFAWVIMFLRILLMAGVLSRPLLRELLLPLGCMLVITLIFALGYYLVGLRGVIGGVNEVPLSNPFSLWSATKFGLLFAVVLLLVEVSRNSFAPSSVVWVGALAGLTDVDAITLSMTDFAKTPELMRIAVHAIVAAVMANTFVKCGLALGLGSKGLGGRMLPASALLLGVGLVFMVI